MIVTDDFFGDQVDWVTGAGLGHESDDPPPQPCTATIDATATGGITGTMSCANVNDPTLVFAIEATFSAEPPPGSVSPGSSPAAALTCPEYLTAAEITGATGRPAQEGVAGQAFTPGEISCAYELIDGGALNLQILSGPAARSYYDGTLADLNAPVFIPGLGVEATYGRPRTLAAVVKEALAVLGEGFTFTLSSHSVDLGQAELQTLAELLVGRLGGGTSPGPPPDGAPVLTTGSATFVLEGGIAGSLTVPFVGEHPFTFGPNPLPTLSWSSDQGGLDIVLPEPRIAGTWSTLAGEVGMRLSMVGATYTRDDQVAAHTTSFGLGFEFTDRAADCTVTIRATETGGIAGTFICADLDNPSDPGTAHGDFTAEPGGTSATG
jgi:hypothetical protein